MYLLLIGVVIQVSTLVAMVTMTTSFLTGFIDLGSDLDKETPQISTSPLWQTRPYRTYSKQHI